MRALVRTIVILATGFLLGALLVTPASARSVMNTSASWYTAQSWWGTADPQGSGEWSAFFVQVPINAPPEQPLIADFSDNHTVPATCDAGTPDDTTDDWASAAGTVTLGMAVAPAVTGFTHRLEGAVISGTMVLQTYDIDACGFMDPVGDPWEVAFTATFTGTGRISGWHDGWHESMPGEWLSHGAMQSRVRSAVGSLLLGEDELEFDPSDTMLALNRMTSHDTFR